MPRPTGFTDADVPDLAGKCILVTGANTGIGLATCHVLAARGARVWLGCRDGAKAEAAMMEIRRSTPGADLHFLPLDQADIDSIRVAAALMESEPRLDVLVNNAGVMIPPLTRTQQGFELQFGVNHLGCFALTCLLLPKLAQTEGARVVVTSSIAHLNAHIDWDDLNAEKSYNRFPRYAASKLANALFFFELDRRLRAAGSPVMAVGCHPGVAATDLGRYGGPLRFFNPLVKLLLNSAEMGAWPALQAATGEVTPGGYYGSMGFREMRGKSGEAFRTAQARDPVLARRLWDVSVAMTGVDPGLAPVD